MQVFEESAMFQGPHVIISKDTPHFMQTNLSFEYNAHIIQHDHGINLTLSVYSLMCFQKDMETPCKYLQQQALSISLLGRLINNHRP